MKGSCTTRASCDNLDLFVHDDGLCRLSKGGTNSRCFFHSWGRGGSFVIVCKCVSVCLCVCCIVVLTLPELSLLATVHGNVSDGREEERESEDDEDGDDDGGEIELLLASVTHVRVPASASAVRGLLVTRGGGGVPGRGLAVPGGWGRSVAVAVAVAVTAVAGRVPADYLGGHGAAGHRQTDNQFAVHGGGVLCVCCCYVWCK